MHADIRTNILCAVILLLAILLIATAEQQVKYQNSIIRFFYALPFLAEVLITAMTGASWRMAGFYAGVLVLLAGLVTEKKFGKRLVAVLAALLMSASLIWINVSAGGL